MYVFFWWASGVARGSGWQHIGAYINLGAFYVVGLPVAIILGFVVHLKAKGLWIGIVTGSVVQSTLLSIITGLTNWKKQVLVQILQFSSKFVNFLFHLMLCLVLEWLDIFMWILQANKARERIFEGPSSVENRSELNEPKRISDEVVTNWVGMIVLLVYQLIYF